MLAPFIRRSSATSEPFSQCLRNKKRSGARSSIPISVRSAKRWLRLNTRSNGSSNSFQLSSRSQLRQADRQWPARRRWSVFETDQLRAGAAQDLQLEFAEMLPKLIEMRQDEAGAQCCRRRRAWRPISPSLVNAARRFAPVVSVLQERIVSPSGVSVALGRSRRKRSLELAFQQLDRTRQ